MKIKIPQICAFILSILLFLAGPCTQTALGEDYLSAGEIAAISASSVGIAVLGKQVKNGAPDKKSFIGGPILFDTKLQKLLGGSCRPGKTNFLDNTFGSALTPAINGAMLLAADLSWPATDDKGKMVAQDFFIYSSGLLATKGVTSLAKGLVARERPLPCLEPDIAVLREDIDYVDDKSSFFSGHVSGAFFSAVYVNKRLRSIMRHELTPDEYDGWSWAPPTLLFSWASVVGWSRIHAYKHYFTDVAAGALAGFLMAELFYSFNDKEINDPASSTQSLGTSPIFYVRFTF